MGKSQYKKEKSQTIFSSDQEKVIKTKIEEKEVKKTEKPSKANEHILEMRKKYSNLPDALEKTMREKDSRGWRKKCLKEWLQSTQG